MMLLYTIRTYISIVHNSQRYVRIVVYIYYVRILNYLIE
nr:MAG TPA: hypothetical protein [Caudoviricetes sp.]